MRPADLLTLLRLALVPLFLAVLFSPLARADYLAAGVFLAAALTDGFDGYLARRRGEATARGEFLDPLVDKALVLSATAALVALGRWPLWAGAILIGRELAVTWLRLAALTRGRRIPVRLWGKLKTLAQVTAVLAGLVPVAPSLRDGLLVLAVILTLGSGIDYLRRGAR
ncbi:MAG: CDP-diacylglycerol--glycerol-3-phosphate 3-phosphatidyltransferase [Desulfotomaculales bacterium]